ncbi:rare lipoA family protein [Neorickettsia helminthoeca str. Oregon]|uniref:Endolytic peptidoglycan transglycosylase RlpA n=1 Tax=Neorickettsia helminthoeca str. Oregon TaxID=1286528 RepID=X5HJW4_9RICK|nr:rare lipoA family protein [Neorickettsia helminthoeca str. Oregon]
MFRSSFSFVLCVLLVFLVPFNAVSDFSREISVLSVRKKPYQREYVNAVHPVAKKPYKSSKKSAPRVFRAKKIVSTGKKDRHSLRLHHRKNLFSKSRKGVQVKDKLMVASYTVKKVTYYPVKYNKYQEVGVASWYGGTNHKKITASGEVFDKHKITAAHKLLPLPSIVKVTNLENGKSLIVRVNDRGPFIEDRLIDLSEKGAKLLGFQGKGLARVKVELISYG